VHEGGIGVQITLELYGHVTPKDASQCLWAFRIAAQ